MNLAIYLIVNTATLAFAARMSQARALNAVVMLLILGFVLGSLNGLIEAVAFDVMEFESAAATAILFLAIFAVIALVAALIAGRLRGESPAPARPNVTPGRIAAIVLGYELLYFGAGMLAWPFIQHFYAGKAMPSFAMVAGLQIPRALIFAGVAWAWLRGGPKHAPLVLALVFAIIGGVAPLIPDNPFMPPDIRFVHAIEMACSNFLFGLLVGWLLKPKEA